MLAQADHPTSLVLQAVHQSSAVLGLGLIGMAEDLGNAMAHRALEHLLQYGDTAVRLRLVLINPLAAVKSSHPLSPYWLVSKGGLVSPQASLE